MGQATELAEEARRYLCRLITSLLQEGSGFDTKRADGSSDWEFTLAGHLDGYDGLYFCRWVDEDGQRFVEDVDWERYNVAAARLIRRLFEFEEEKEATPKPLRLRHLNLSEWAAMKEEESEDPPTERAGGHFD